MKIINIVITLFLMLTVFNGFSQENTPFFEKANVFLKAHVSEGLVDYANIKANETDLNELMTLAAAFQPSKMESDVYRAFWINAYNISVIKGVIDNFPMKSPLDKAGFFNQTTYKLAGKNITLNTIENTILRGEFNDARFHFVLVCGALGCPPLIGEAYLPDSIEKQLNMQTSLALNSNLFIKINDKKKRVYGSEILKWYKKDFEIEGKSEIDFINSFRDDNIPDNYSLKYFTYNWKLNIL